MEEEQEEEELEELEERLELEDMDKGCYWSDPETNAATTNLA